MKHISYKICVLALGPAVRGLLAARTALEIHSRLLPAVGAAGRALRHRRAPWRAVRQDPFHPPCHQLAPTPVPSPANRQQSVMGQQSVVWPPPGVAPATLATRVNVSDGDSCWAPANAAAGNRWGQVRLQLPIQPRPLRKQSTCKPCVSCRWVARSRRPPSLPAFSRSQNHSQPQYHSQVRLTHAP